MSLDKDNIKLIFKITFFGLFDAIALWSSITLYTQHSFRLLALLLVGTVLLNIVYLSKRTYPLRYILPGTLFMIMLVIYPLLYTVYVSTTNYGTAHILTKKQVISQLENRYFLADDAASYRFNAYTEENGQQLIVLLEDETGRQLLGEKGQAVLVSPADSRLVDSDSDGKIDRIKGYGLLKKAEIFKNLSRLQKLEYHYQGDIIKMKNFSQFVEYEKQYQYLPEQDQIHDLKNNIYYHVENGYFVSPGGERLLPGYRTGVGLNNFKRLFTDRQISSPFIRVFIWTVEWAFFSVVTTFALGLLLAILLNDPRLKFKTFYRVILILPYAIPAFISVLIWRGLFDTEVGVINQILENLFGAGLPWLESALWAKIALIIINLWLGFPYMMIIALGALQSISSDYYEAAAIDGASSWQQFRYITFPMILVSLAPLLISSFAYNFNNFVLIYLYNKGRPAIVGAQTPAGSTDILISYTYRLSFESGRGADFGLASAVTIIIFAITALITWFNFRYTGALEDVKENA